MEQSQRTGIARGGLSFMLAAVVIFAVGATRTYPSDGIIAALVVLGVAVAIASQVLDNPVLAAVWFAPVVAAIVLFLQQDTPSENLVTQSVVVGAIGVAQVLFSQVGR
ncbi:hypothetical protein [Haloarchaeobius sp. DYHT-AS-18]|uniref:hypothetical protein n=1 Tax=Haloarchaeobius sp. DYHT-AS-18 TaxID=3446117 RepID=UPI003EC099E6